MSDDASRRRSILGVLKPGVGLTASEVGRRAHLSTSVAARLLKELVKDGAARSAVASDKRTIVYSLS